MTMSECISPPPILTLSEALKEIERLKAEIVGLRADAILNRH